MRQKRSKLEWAKSTILQKRVGFIAKTCQLDHVKTERVFCYETTGAKTRAYARIWGLNRIWQTTLETEPAYVLEVVSEKFNRLSTANKDQVLIHELLHIPKNFSGALVPHKRKGGVNQRKVREIYEKYYSSW